MENFKKNIPTNVLKSIHEQALVETLSTFAEFYERQENGSMVNQVINAIPGHGKTTALKLFAKTIFERADTHGILITFRQKSHLHDVADYLKNNDIPAIAVDSDTYQSIRSRINSGKIVLITQQRLRNLVINQNEEVNMFMKWRENSRIIISDERPIFEDAVSYSLSDGFRWIDDSLKGTSFSEDECNEIRCIIVNLFETELRGNKGQLTQSFFSQPQSQQDKEKILIFFSEVKKREDMLPASSESKFRWFQELCNKDYVGYLDPENSNRGELKPKAILCGKRIDYRTLGCSMLILDGTAEFALLQYRDFEIVSTSDYTKYERLTVFHRQYDTTKRARGKRKTHNLIAKDIQLTNVNKEDLHVLTGKSDKTIYELLGVLPDSQTGDEEEDEMHIFNTVGKNELSEKNALYLACLPLHAPEHYKKIAICHYTGAKPLSLRMSRKKKVWFEDPFIEKIHKEMLLGEIIQIIHRSSIRRLLVPGTVPVNIYIATNITPIITDLKMVLKQRSQKVNFETSVDFGKTIKLEKKVQSFATEVIKNIRIKGTMLPSTAAKILSDPTARDFMSRHYEKNKELFQDVFKKLGLMIVTNERNGYREIVWRDDSTQ